MHKGWKWLTCGAHAVGFGKGHDSRQSWERKMQVQAGEVPSSPSHLSVGMQYMCLSRHSG